MATICQTIQNEHVRDRIQNAKVKEHNVKDDWFNKGSDYLPEEMTNGTDR